MKSNKKLTPKQLLAFIGIFLLVAMYLVALILALINTPWAKQMLYIALVSTFAIPIIIYVIMMFYKLAHRGESQSIEVPTKNETIEEDESAIDEEKSE